VSVPVVVTGVLVLIGRLVDDGRLGGYQIAAIPKTRTAADFPFRA
jgi:hypothetical protein